MPEVFNEVFQQDADISLLVLVARLAVALGLGGVVAAIYRFTRRPSSGDTASLVPTLVLLTVIIAMVTLAIGNSVARAFSLVGALAIVRFRTVVEDTRDTAFVILAVAVGLAVGAGFLMVPLVGIPFAAIAAFSFRRREPTAVTASRSWSLSLRLGAGHAPDTLLKSPFDAFVDQSHLVSVATARQGTALDVTYRLRLKNDEQGPALVSTLNRLEGVQEVELRQAGERNG